MAEETDDSSVAAAEVDPVEGANPGSMAPAAESAVDLPRKVLRDLMELAAQCAAREAALAQEYTAATAEVDAREKRTLSNLEGSWRHLQEQLAKKFQEQQDQAQARRTEQTEAAKAADAAAQKQARQTCEAIQSQLKKNYDQVVWEADIQLEAEQNRLRAELQQMQETNAATLKAKHDQLFALLARYGHVPDAEAAAAGDPSDRPTIPTATADIQSQFDRHVAEIDKALRVLEQTDLAKFFVGAWPYVLFAVVVLLAVGIPQLLPGVIWPDLNLMGITGTGAVVFMALLLLLLRWMARRAVRRVYRPAHHALFYADLEARAVLEAAKKTHDADLAKARHRHKTEVHSEKVKAEAILEKARAARDTALASSAAARQAALLRVEEDYAVAEGEARRWRDERAVQMRQKYQQELENIRQGIAADRLRIKTHQESQRTELEQTWTQGLSRLQTPVESEAGGPAVPTGRWDHWVPPRSFAQTVRFGELAVDVQAIVRQAAKDGPFTLEVPSRFAMPALLAFPRHASLLIHADRGGRPAALAALQAVMTRLLTTVPPGRVRFTLIDPVGLGQNFAGFMHLTDYDEALVGGRIWTQAEQIDQRLADLTDHMETVIQKYLRNEFETIDDYNIQAGELAEPYRFLVIADLPVGFSDESLRRLSSIATTGARCGVYTLVFRDTRVAVPGGTHLEDLESHSINLVYQDDRFVWRDEVFSRFPLTLDAAPDENDLTTILHLVGKQARESKRVEVSFAALAPDPNSFWTRHSDGDLQAAVGRSGATRLQTFRLGKGVAQHALVTGKTGSGKSTLMHVLVTNLAMWYSPQELELYLIDFKKGVEFKTYATHRLPHARAIAVESDREFGLSVLQRIDAELGRRGDLFRAVGAQDLAGYRQASHQPLPRTLLVIDEFQEFFSEDDKLGQDAALLLDRLVRQGRAFGIHVLLGSQTIAGSSGLSRSTIGQVAVRIALQTTEADSQVVLADGNSAARLLSRPGEAIYNDAGGLVEGNSPFQVAWLNDEQRDQYLEAVRKKADLLALRTEPTIIFEGNTPADIRKNRQLMALLEAPRVAVNPKVWLGEPVAIKDPTSIVFRRQSGGNVMLIGQSEEQALAIMSAAMLALAAQQTPDTSLYILDGSATDSPSFGVLAATAGVTKLVYNNVEYRAVPEVINELAQELQRRQGGTVTAPPAIFIFVLGLQRYRPLRKSEDAFGLSSSGDDKEADPGKQFADLLREGPAWGIHLMIWTDTVVSIDRALDRNSMREFDTRVLFQMSASDSSNLIDSPAANRLGPCRALAYSEEQGTLEKFRSYAVPDTEFLQEAQRKLAARPVVAG